MSVQDRPLQKNDVRVRYAPSPTGIPHVGNIRTALFDYFYAKSNDGEFILRIEDTDQARKVDGAEEAIKESLLWLGAEWDQYVVQSERLSEYKNYAKELVDKNMAKHEDSAIRFIVPKAKGGKISWHDAIGDKEISYEYKDVEDFIILKKDGYPTYHLANVVDDHLMGITHVIRGNDWIPSTPKHILLYQAFSWEQPIFAHVPNVLGVDKQKLSKRKGAKSVLDFKNEGYLSEALLNYLMLLGWSPSNDRTIVTREDILREFRLEKVNVAPAVFDERKLLWMNGEYIREMKIEELSKRLLEFDSSIGEVEHYQEYIPLAQTRMKTLAEFKSLVVKEKDSEINDNVRKLAKKLKDEYEKIEDWNSDIISKTSLRVRDELECTTKDVFFALSGKPQGLPFDKVAEIEGKEATISWLEFIFSK